MTSPEKTGTLKAQAASHYIKLEHMEPVSHQQATLEDGAALKQAFHHQTTVKQGTMNHCTMRPHSHHEEQLKIKWRP